jgi:hypothetical protein
MTSALFGRVSALLALSIAVDTSRYIREPRYGIIWQYDVNIVMTYPRSRTLVLSGLIIQTSKILVCICVKIVSTYAILNGGSKNELDMFCMRRSLL